MNEPMSYTKETLASVMVGAQAMPACTVDSMCTIAYPHWDMRANSGRLAVASVVEVSTKNGDKHTVVVVCYRDKTTPVYAFWCGDRLLEGSIVEATRVNRYRVFGGDSEKYACHGISPVNARCCFWSNMLRDNSICEHVEHALAFLHYTYEGSLGASLEEMLITLEQEIQV